MTISRRTMILTAGVAAVAKAFIPPARAETTSSDAATRPNYPFVPVTTPNNRSLPFVMKDGVKEFHLVAEEVAH